MIESEVHNSPVYKDLAETLKDGLKPEVQEKILELRHIVLALQEENLQLRERVRQLEAGSTTANKVVFDKGVYWTVTAGMARQGPYCPACQDKNGKLVRLHYTHTGTPGVYWICKSCHQNW